MSHIMPTGLWTCRAKVVRVVDGDTADIYLDAGFRSFREERLRLLGVNCPEVHGATREAGLAATAYTRDWLATGASADPWPLRIVTSQSDVFGRYLALVFRITDGACLNDDLLASGHAEPFMV